MQIDRDSLSKKYRGKTDDDLLNLHSSGDLTEAAYEVIESEMGRRNIPIPQRPEIDDRYKNTQSVIKNYWYGKARLANAFWLLGVLGGVFATFIFRVFLNLVVLQIPNFPLRIILLSISFIFLLGFIIFVYVSIWRCAWNTDWKGWGYIARFLIFLKISIILMPFIINIWNALISN
jgi:hypothetical protein